MTTQRASMISALRKSALLSTSGLGMWAIMSGPTLAQATSAQGTETVVVTGSQLITNGINAPTPVTVVTATDLIQATPRTITDSLVQLPVFRNNTDIQNQSTGTTGSNGADFLNLRGLGTTRTLVLLNGEESSQ